MSTMHTPPPITWAEAVVMWTAALTAAGRSAATIRTRADHVRRLGRALGGCPWEVTTAQLLAYGAAHTWARETRRSVGASVRSFYRWAHATGLVPEDPAAALPTVAPSPARPRPAPEAVYRQALAVADTRTTLILRLAAEAGLRRGEVSRVHSRDLMADLTGWSLLVHGKGNRERVVPLPDGLAATIVALGPGWLFPGDDAGHLSPRWVGKLATRVLPDDWTLHTLRHRFATAAYRVDRDLLVVQTILGHASPATTRRYVLVPDDALRATVRAVSAL